MGGRLRRLLSRFFTSRVLMEFVFGSPLRPRLNPRIEGMNIHSPMSFYTARVKTGSALVEHKNSALAPKTGHLCVNEYTP